MLRDNFPPEQQGIEDVRMVDHGKEVWAQKVFAAIRWSG
jgi:hypothetical protein